jgi:hypothetical protein
MLIAVKAMACFCACKTGIHDIPVNNHRRRWIESRIRILSSLFDIDICRYAVMSNPIHLVIKLVPQEAQSWTDNEVIDRWTHLSLIIYDRAACSATMAR